MRIAVDLIVGGRLAVRTPIGEGVMTLGASQSSDLACRTRASIQRI